MEGKTARGASSPAKPAWEGGSERRRGRLGQLGGSRARRDSRDASDAPRVGRNHRRWSVERAFRMISRGSARDRARRVESRRRSRAGRRGTPGDDRGTRRARRGSRIARGSAGSAALLTRRLNWNVGSQKERWAHPGRRGRSDAYLDHAGAVIAHEGGNLTFVGHVDSLRGRDGTIVSRALGMSRARWAPPRGGERKKRQPAPRVAHRGLFETAIRAENRAGRVGRGARGRPQDGLGFFTHLCCSSSKATGVRALAVARWLE